MICSSCCEAADRRQPKKHEECEGCECQHRYEGEWIQNNPSR